ncbi:hypothetical protein EN816_00825 [Mesorhizobium sp. M8A.F.Ca.ET.173.01.1.1]|nr:hypothetical protein EN816_00825 [Mesorhizobium sp. M8A.F.Ca.ET.173.01.1.1]
MAADSLAGSNGWLYPYPAEKLHRLPDGTVAALCGTLAEATKFVRWLKDGEQGDEPPLAESTVIRLRKDGTLTIYEAGASFDIKPDFGAWGSGGPAANAAMHMGADAAKAVEVAALLDDATGGAIITMKCEI